MRTCAVFSRSRLCTTRHLAPGERFGGEGRGWKKTTCTRTSKIRQQKSNQAHVHRDRPRNGSRNPRNDAEVDSRRSRPKSAPLWHDFSKHDSFAALSRQFWADGSADTTPRGSQTRDQSICRGVEWPPCRQATLLENGRRDHCLAMGKRKVGGD